MARGNDEPSRFRPGLKLDHRVARTAAVALRPAFRPRCAASAARWIGIPGLALELVPLRLGHLRVDGNRPLPRGAAVAAREIVELLFVAQEKEPELSVAAVEPHGEI